MRTATITVLMTKATAIMPRPLSLVAKSNLESILKLVQSVRSEIFELNSFGYDRSYCIGNTGWSNQGSKTKNIRGGNS